MTLEEVKAAYRVAAMRLHPDRGGSTEAMQELNNAFEIAFAMAQKFSKANTTDTKQQPKTAESASSHRRQFYTVNGWQGERYDRNLTTKDIAQLIREYVKTAYPTYRFSITSDVNSITIALTEYPVELTNSELMLKYYHTNYHQRWSYIPSKGKIETVSMTQSDIEEWIRYQVEMEYCEQKFSKSDTWLNPVIYAVLKDVQDFMNSYNYDDTNSMEDYFDRNFYDYVQIGKDDKPAKFVERTARSGSTKKKKKSNSLPHSNKLTGLSRKFCFITVI